MKTKLLSLFLTLASCVGTIFATGTKIGDLYYNLNSANRTAEVTYARYVTSGPGGHTVTYYGPDVTVANIPNEVNGHRVTGIGSYAFSNCENLTSVTLGENITSIGVMAFVNCSALTTISISNNVISIDEDAFSSCISLPVENNVRYADTYLQGVADKTQENYIIREGTRWIGDGAFSGCKKMKSIDIPESVTVIGENAFSSCDSLNSVSIPNSVNRIGKRAFEGCKSLKSLTMGNGVRHVGWNAFGECDSLAAVYISDLAAWCLIDFNLETYSISNPIVYNGALYLNGEQLTDVHIPNSVSRIGRGTFIGYHKMSSLRLPSSITYIGESAFEGCSNITSLIIPNSVDTIEDYAFCQCDSLKSVIIGQSCSYVGRQAFGACEKMYSCVIGENVQTMLNSFDQCYNLTRINCLIKYPSEQVSIYLRDDSSNPVYLYVPSSSIHSYENTAPYKYYKGTSLYIQGLGRTQNVETTEVAIMINKDENITSSYTDGKLKWPAINDASLYFHDIMKDGQMEYSFVSDAAGNVFWGDFYGSGADSTCIHQTAELTGAGWTMNYSFDNGAAYTYTVTTMYDPQVVLYIKSAEVATQPTKFEVSFYNWDGELLQREYVVEGEMPVYSGETPMRPNDEEYTYTFKGWNPEIVAASWETDNYYYAVYDAKPIGEGIEDIYSDTSSPSKILYDGQIFIPHGDKTFTIQGQAVK